MHTLPLASFRQGDFVLELSLPALEALAAIGMRGSGLTVLSEIEKVQLITKLQRRLR